MGTQFKNSKSDRNSITFLKNACENETWGFERFSVHWIIHGIYCKSTWESRPQTDRI